MSGQRDPKARQPESPAAGAHEPESGEPESREPESREPEPAPSEGDVNVAAEDAAVDVERDLEKARIAQERDDYLDALRRLQADFENYKKRMLRQQTEYLERAAEISLK